ncbi:MAG: tRNA(Ile)-lysidine synthase [Verrucomicrobiota bacterium]|jgi:tRNA(Ile)-lysidine synthase
MLNRPSDRHGFELKILQHFPTKQRYLVGVSGGRDSVALLHHLVESGYQRLVVCHLDHQLRGRSSGGDARFVERLAARLDCRFELGRTDVATLARESKQSPETAGRAARYEFFARIARRRRCPTIFLGHHADDLVETFLMNLFRGAGPAGLSGMREITSRRIAGTDLRVVRPLLGVWREEIDRYAETRRLKFREDLSNESLEPVRNRLRRRLIPYIEKQLGRKVRSTLWRAATIAADEAEWLETLVDPAESESEQLDVPKLRAHPRALQRRIIQKWLRSRGVGNLDFELIERVRGLVDPDAPAAKTNLPQDRHVRRRAKKIFID